MDGAVLSFHSRKSQRILLMLMLTLAVGATLRLLWGEDIEHKLDEAWSFHYARHWSEYDNPWLGMPSSQNFRNPGMSQWIFVGPTTLFDLQSPVELARVVQLSNILAIGLFLWFAWRWVPVSEREPWLWAVALVCFNPLAVLFHRKIWPPSVLPLFSILMLMSWWKRGSRSGSFFWGLLGGLMLQVHLAGLFYAAGIWFWTVLFRRENARWGWWLVGSLLAAIPLIPWAAYLLGASHSPNTDVFQVHRIFELKFWTHWMTEPFGMGLTYSLGDHFKELLRYPTIGGQATYLVLILHLLLGLIMIASLMTAGWNLIRERPKLRAWLAGNGSPARMIVQAVMLGYGLLLTLAMLRFYRHYLILTFPFMYIWTAIIVLRSSRGSLREQKVRRGMMLTLCLAQLFLTISFMGYIHEKGGAPAGDYKLTYGRQVELDELPNVQKKMSLAKARSDSDSLLPVDDK